MYELLWGIFSGGGCTQSYAGALALSEPLFKRGRESRGTSVFFGKIVNTSRAKVTC